MLLELSPASEHHEWLAAAQVECTKLDAAAWYQNIKEQVVHVCRNCLETLCSLAWTVFKPEHILWPD